MGTSSSYDGPADQNPLLPDWALPNDIKPDQNVFDEDAEDNKPVEDDSHSETNEVPAQTPFTEPNWKNAKLYMTHFAARGGRDHFKKAAHAYTKAKGGPRAASKQAHHGKKATANVGTFLSALHTEGVVSYLRNQGLQDIIGKPVELVLNRIAELLSPSGKSFDEIAARKANDEVMKYLYEHYLNDNPKIELLDHISEADIKECLRINIVSYVYNLWLVELGNRIEVRAISEDQAISIERQMKSFLFAMVNLTFETIPNIISFNWSGAEGKQIIEELYKDAYSMLES